jgi:hypothetical protein
LCAGGGLLNGSTSHAVGDVTMRRT